MLSLTKHMRMMYVPMARACHCWEMVGHVSGKCDYLERLRVRERDGKGLTLSATTTTASLGRAALCLPIPLSTPLKRKEQYTVKIPYTKVILVNSSPT